MRAILFGVCGFGLIAQDPVPRNPNYLPPAMRAATDPVRVDPAHYSVDSETDGMLALRLKLAADETAPMVFIQDSLIVCLSECHVRLTLPKFARFTIKKGATEPEYSGQQTVDIHMEAGTTRLIGAGIRSIANLSTHPVEMLFIERRQLGSELNEDPTGPRARVSQALGLLIGVAGSDVFGLRVLGLAGSDEARRRAGPGSCASRPRWDLWSPSAPAISSSASGL
jgi:hypothetical protein